jgi:methionyl-tRNA synthetase
MSMTPNIAEYIHQEVQEILTTGTARYMALCHGTAKQAQISYDKFIDTGHSAQREAFEQYYREYLTYRIIERIRGTLFSEAFWEELYTKAREP